MQLREKKKKRGVMDAEGKMEIKRVEYSYVLFILHQSF
jgi:hypothetical protein